MTAGDAGADPRRLTAQWLTGPPATTPEQVVRRILAVQAQDGRGARLAIRARTMGTGLTAADVDAALTERRSLVVSCLHRGTLHLVASDDLSWLHWLTTPQLATGIRRRLSQLEVTPAEAEQGTQVIAAALASGPKTRRELRDTLDAAGVPTAGQALVHLLAAASLPGSVVRGPMQGREQCFVATESWLGPSSSAVADRPAALAQLARRYLAGHGPATAGDLAKWAGIRSTDARSAMTAILGEVVEAGDGAVDLADRPAPAAIAPPRLLGPFDPLLHGWASMEPVIGKHRGIVTTNGLFRPFALVEGRAVATWGLAGGTVTLRPLERIRRADVQALEDDALDVLRYLGLPPTRLVVDP